LLEPRLLEAELALDRAHAAVPVELSISSRQQQSRPALDLVPDRLLRAGAAWVAAPYLLSIVERRASVRCRDLCGISPAVARAVAVVVRDHVAAWDGQPSAGA
jgi:hypothetical protein